MEHLSGCVRNKQVDRLSLLKEAAEQQNDLRTAVFHFDQILERYVTSWTMLKVQEQALQEAEKQLFSVLTASS